MAIESEGLWNTVHMDMSPFIPFGEGNKMVGKIFNLGHVLIHPHLKTSLRVFVPSFHSS